MTMPHFKRALSEAEAASYIGMSRSYLRQSRMDGERENRTPGPRLRRIGTRCIRYLIDDLDAWLDQFPVGDASAIGGAA
jgi:hypothetical protein